MHIATWVHLNSKKKKGTKCYVAQIVFMYIKYVFIHIQITHETHYDGFFWGGEREGCEL